MPRRLVISLVPLFVACAPSAEGSWEGTLACDDDDTDVVLTMELESVGGGLHEGPLTLAFEQRDDAYDILVAFDIHYDAELQIDGGGEQDVDLEATYDDLDCRVFVAGELFSDSCEELGVDDSDLQDASDDLGDVTWDGGDVLTVESEGCEGELVRSK